MFIVLAPVWSEGGMLFRDREIVEIKNHSINSRACA